MNVDRRLNISAYSEADKLYRAGHYKEAIRLFQAASHADPDDPDCWMAIGSCYDSLERPEDAERAYMKAIDLCRPDQLPALNYNIGNSYFDRGMYEHALQYYKLIPNGHDCRRRADINRDLAIEKMSGR